MQEKHLAIIAISCATIGIVLLFILEQYIEPQKLSVRALEDNLIGNRVEVKGRVDWALERENFLLFTLNDGEKIKAIKFNPTELEMELIRKRIPVVVVGKLQVYKNELEIVVEEIRKW
tara:strand:- start:11434 stop:11787 length:354 start_codon:yes stop_codon:yes gene_type:complete